MKILTIISIRNFNENILKTEISDQSQFHFYN